MEDIGNEDDKIIIERAIAQKSILEIAIDFLRHLSAGLGADDFSFPETIVQLIDFPITLSDSKTIIDSCATFNFPMKKRGLLSSLSWLWSVFVLKKWRFLANFEGKSTNLSFKIDVEETEYLSAIPIAFSSIQSESVVRSLSSEPKFQKQLFLYKKYLLRESFKNSTQNNFNLEAFVRTNIKEPIVIEETEQNCFPKVASDKKIFYVSKEVDNGNEIPEEAQVVFNNAVEKESDTKGNFGLGGKNSKKDLINFKDIYRKFMKNKNYPGFEQEIEIEPERKGSDLDEELINKIDYIIDKAQQDRAKLREILKNQKRRIKYVPPKKKTEASHEKKKNKANTKWIESDSTEGSSPEEDGYRTEPEGRVELVKLKSRTPRIKRKMKFVKRRGRNIILSSSDSACEELEAQEDQTHREKNSSSAMPIEISSSSDSSSQSVIITYVKTKISKFKRQHRSKKAPLSKNKNGIINISDDETEKRLWRKLKKKLDDRISLYLSSETPTPNKIDGKEGIKEGEEVEVAVVCES